MSGDGPKHRGDDLCRFDWGAGVSWQTDLGYIRIVGPDEPRFRAAVKRVWDLLEKRETDYARLRGTLLAIEAMPVRLQLGNKLAENPAITHDAAARALWETQPTLTTDDSRSEPPDIETDDDFEI